MKLYSSQSAKPNTVNKMKSYKMVRGFKTKPFIFSRLKPLIFMYDGIFIKETLSRIFKEGSFQSESNIQL